MKAVFQRVITCEVDDFPDTTSREAVEHVANNGLLEWGIKRGMFETIDTKWQVRSISPLPPGEKPKLGRPPRLVATPAASRGQRRTKVKRRRRAKVKA